MLVALAGFAGMEPEHSDDPLLLDRLGQAGVQAVLRPWTDDSFDWDAADLVVVRSTWDYPRRHAQFVAWVQGLTTAVVNAPPLIVWNSDKRYLADLAGAGVPTVPTTYVQPGDPLPALSGEVVVKPTVSAGARDTGRFGPDALDAAAALIERLSRSGRTTMVQPYLPSVDQVGETAVVIVDGQVSHVLRKRSVLRPDEVAPLRADALGAAEAMYDPGLVGAGAAEQDEHHLAQQVLEVVRQRFGGTPVHLRVDMLRDRTGRPALLELEAVEPHLYLTESPGAVDRLADAIVGRAREAQGRRRGFGRVWV